MRRAPDADHEVRWCVLKLADLLIRGAEETPPKVTIHLPPTPVTEVPPPLPPVKLPVKPQRSFKSGGPPKTPITPVTGTPKLKLLPSSSQVDISVKLPATPAPEHDRKPTAFSIPKLPKKALPAEKKPPKNVPKGQSGGMSLNDLRACRNALKKLQVNKRATLFLQPVDPVRDRAPKYIETLFSPNLDTNLGTQLL